MSQLSAVLLDGMDLSEVSRPALGPRPIRYRGVFTPDASMELLRTISEALDIRRVFQRVSEIASQVLPHDCLELAISDASNHLTLEARSISGFPEFRRLALGGEPFRIVSDLRTMRPLPTVCDPPDFVDRVVAEGYRSLLVVRELARRQPIALLFFSTETDGFTLHDVPAARQIAAYVALVLSHDQLASAAVRSVEAHPPAERLDRRVQPVTASWQPGAGGLPTIGQSPEWKDVLKRATLVASTEATVSIQGESGTGKEIIARAIHRASARRAGPFVAINCAALPEHLLESEFFGYERGAFTGAQQSKPGQIELASGGVLFLDEVSEMSSSAQAKLLRVLQEREFLRLGGTRLLKVNVRVVAATNRDLSDAVARGSFRRDLYYRLQVFDIRIPPLRDRASDIPLFVDAFLQEIARSMRVPPVEVTPEASRVLLRTRGPATCESCATCSSAPRFSARAGASRRGTCRFTRPPRPLRPRPTCGRPSAGQSRRSWAKQVATRPRPHVALV